MKINIKQYVIEEGLMDAINAFNANNNDSSSQMNTRADAIKPLGTDELMKKATGFRTDKHQMALTDKFRDFITGSKSGSQMTAEDKFTAKRNLELNK